MTLTRQERWFLSNQYEILNKLYDDGRYDNAIEALNSGYEAEYESLCAGIYENDVLSKDECDEVVQIMTMYSALQASYEQLTDKSGIEEHMTKFPGDRVPEFGPERVRGWVR